MSRFAARRGVNVWGWLRSKRGSAEPRTTFDSDDFRFIKDRGFDHVRLPATEETLWDDNGRRIPDAWRRLDAALDWSEEAGLRAIFDLHILRTHFFNAEHKPLFTDPDAPAQFGRLWEQLSEAMRHRSHDQVAYELMNEPVAENPEDWNRVYRFAYDAVRSREPERTIVLGGNRWSNVYSLKHLRVPGNDPHVLITFHFYDPMPVTHYRAGFTPIGKAYDGPVRYPGVPLPQEEFDRLPPEAQELFRDSMRHYDASVLEEEVLEAVAVRDGTGLPIYCGEFGAIANAPADVRRRWARDIRGVLEKHDIGWCAWMYKSGGESSFALFEEDGTPTPVCEALLE